MTVIDLWLPILAAGLATHIASTLAWTVLPHHKPEIKGLGDKEDDLLDWLQRNAVAPDQYLFPYCDDMKEAGSEAFKQKQARCTGQLVLWEQPISMGTAIAKTLTFFMVTALVIGWLAAFALEPIGAAVEGQAVDARGTTQGVFCFVFALGVLAHCFAKFPHLFWFQQKYRMALLDGVVYALLTAGIFTALWPSTEAPPQQSQAGAVE